MARLELSRHSSFAEEGGAHRGAPDTEGRGSFVTRSAAIAAVMGLWVALAAGGCTEAPRLDTVGGNGKIADARPSCDETPADGSPRAFPCDVEAVLEAKCQRCHNSKAELDRCYPEKTCLKGPFPLLTWSDTHQIYGEKPIFERMYDAVLSGFMPFQTTDISPPTVPLTPSEKETLLVWARACAPPRTTACSTSDGDAAVLSEGGEQQDR